MATYTLQIPKGHVWSGVEREPYPKPEATRECALHYAPPGHEVPTVRSLDFSIGVDTDMVDCCNAAHKQHVCGGSLGRMATLNEFLQTAEVGNTIEIGRIPQLGWAEAVFWQTANQVTGLSFSVTIRDVDGVVKYTAASEMGFDADPCDVQTDYAEMLENTVPPVVDFVGETVTYPGGLSPNYVRYADIWSVVLEVTAIPAEFTAGQCPCEDDGPRFWFKVQYRDSSRYRDNIEETCITDCVPTSLTA